MKNYSIYGVLIFLFVFTSCFGKQEDIIQENGAIQEQEENVELWEEDETVEEFLWTVVDNGDGTQSLTNEGVEYGSDNIEQQDISQVEESVVEEVPWEIIDNEDGTQSIIAGEEWYEEFQWEQIELNDPVESLGTIVDNGDGTQSIVLEEE